MTLGRHNANTNTNININIGTSPSVGLAFVDLLPRPEYSAGSKHYLLFGDCEKHSLDMKSGTTCFIRTRGHGTPDQSTIFDIQHGKYENLHV